MTVHTDIRPDDWKAFVRFIVQRSAKGSGGGLGTWLIAVGFGVALGLASSLTGLALHFPSLLLGLVGFSLWFVIISRLRQQRLFPAADGVILGPQSVTLADDGLRVFSPRHNAFFQWSCVRGTQVTHQHVFVMVDTSAAVIIPKRAFSSDAELGQFVVEVQNQTSRKNA